MGTNYNAIECLIVHIMKYKTLNNIVDCIHTSGFRLYSGMLERNREKQRVRKRQR